MTDLRRFASDSDLLLAAVPGLSRDWRCERGGGRKETQDRPIKQRGDRDRSVGQQRRTMHTRGLTADEGYAFFRSLTRA